LLGLFLVYVKEFVIFYWENNKIDEKDNIVVILHVYHNNLIICEYCNLIG